MGGLSLCHMLKVLSARSAASWADRRYFCLAWPEALGQTSSMHRAPYLQGWVLLLAAFWVDLHGFALAEVWLQNRWIQGLISRRSPFLTGHVS